MSRDNAEHRAPAPLFSVLVVGYNSSSDIRHLLDSMRTLPSWEDCEILIAENGNREVSAMEALATEFGAKLLLLPNPGFGTACNRLAELARGEVILLANPDLRFQEDILPSLRAHLLRNPRVGAVGPSLRDDDGSLQISWNMPMGLKWEFLEANGLQTWWRRKVIRQHQSANPGGPWSVGLCTAACLSIRASLFRQIGGFDEDFFLNSEDIELCDRIRGAGHEVHVLPGIWSYHGNSRLQSRDLGLFVFHRLQGKAVYLRKRYRGVRKMVAAMFFLEQVLLRLFAGSLFLRGIQRTRLSGYWKALSLFPEILRA